LSEWLDAKTIKNESQNQELVLRLIEKYNLHGVKLYIVADDATFEARKFRKVPIGEGWQERDNAPSYAELVAHAKRGGGIGIVAGFIMDNVQLVWLDFDGCPVSILQEVWPELLQMAAHVRHDGKPMRGKFIIAVHPSPYVADRELFPLENKSFKLATANHANETMFELLADRLQGVATGKHPLGHHYSWCNVMPDENGVKLPHVTVNELLDKCEAIFACCVKRYALQEAKEAAERVRKEKKSESKRRKRNKSDTNTWPNLPDFPDASSCETFQAGTYQDFDWQTWLDENIPPLATLAYALKYLDVEEAAHWHGRDEIKVPGHAGLHVNLSGTWFSHGLKLGGGLPQLIAFHDWSESHKIDRTLPAPCKADTSHLKRAAAFVGAKWPLFTRAKAVHVPPQIPAGQLMKISEGQYLGQVFDYDSCEMGKVTHVIAPTGVGKTMAIDSLSTATVLAPYQDQAKEFADSAFKRGVDCRAVHGSKKYALATKIYATYDAARKEIRAFESGLIELTGRTLVTDEIHHLNQAAFRDTTALDPLTQLAYYYIYNGGRVITLTGTPAPSYPAPFSYEGAAIVQVEKLRAPRTFSFVEQSDIVESIKQLVERGYTHFVAYLDDKTKCEAFAQLLTKAGIKTGAIHADTKKLKHHEQVVGGEWPEGYAGFICTRLLVDGFSITFPAPEGVKFAVFFDKHLQFGCLNIEQAASRIRNCVPDLFIGLTDEALGRIGKGGCFDFEAELRDVQEELNDYVELALKMKRREINTHIRRGDTIEQAKAKARERVLEEFKGKVVFNEYDGTIYANDRTAHQIVTQRWIAVSHARPDILKIELEAYGYKYNGVLSLVGNSQNAKKRKEAIAVEKKARKEAQLTLVQSEAEHMTISQAQEIRQNAMQIVQNEGEVGQAKVAAASVICRFAKAGLTEQAVKKEVRQLQKLSNAPIKKVEAWARMARIRQVMDDPELYRELQASPLLAEGMTTFFAMIQDGVTFEIGKSYTPEEIIKRMQHVAGCVGVPELAHDKLFGDSRQAVKLLKECFSMNRTTDRSRGEGQKNVWTIGDFHHVELAPIDIDSPKGIYYTEKNVLASQTQATQHQTHQSCWLQHQTGVEAREISFWINEMERGVECGWLDEWVLTSYKQQVLAGRVSADDIRRAYEYKERLAKR